MKPHDPFKELDLFLNSLPHDRSTVLPDFQPCDIKGFEDLSNFGSQFIYVLDLPRDEITYVYAAGQGAGTGRTVVELEDETRGGVSIFNRREALFVKFNQGPNNRANHPPQETVRRDLEDQVASQREGTRA